MRSVVICEGASSALLYVHEARKRGFVPIIVYAPRSGDMDADPAISHFRKRAGSDVVYIKVGDEGYPGLLEKLKKYDIEAVVAGSEYGIRYAELLARDLNLNGNNPETTYMRCTKKGMAEGLRKKGLRCIETAVVSCEEDIDRFWDENGIDEAFMKYDVGVASTNNKICRTRQEAKDNFKFVTNKVNNFGNKSEVLVQERIRGKEYAVNTMSCRGHHIITDVWRYKLVDNGGSDVVFGETRIVSIDSPEMEALKEYALKVVDALGFEYGPCHGEYFIDSKGPVLVETNARPMGASMEPEFYEEIIGSNIADMALDAYADPEKFIENLPQSYVRPKKEANIVIPHSDKGADADVWKYFGGIRDLRSFRFCMSEYGPGTVRIKKTADFESALMVVKLCGSREDVEYDTAEITRMEKEFNSSLQDGDARL